LSIIKFCYYKTGKINVELLKETAGITAYEEEYFVLIQYTYNTHLKFR